MPCLQASHAFYDVILAKQLIHSLHLQPVPSRTSTHFNPPQLSSTQLGLKQSSKLNLTCLLTGIMQGKSVMANPGRRVLTGTELGIVVGSSQEAVTAAMQVAYSMPPPLEEASAIAEEAKTRFEVRLLVAQMCSSRCTYA